MAAATKPNHYRAQDERFFYHLYLGAGRAELSVRSTEDHPNYQANSLRLVLSSAVARGDYGPTYNGIYSSSSGVISISFCEYVETGGKILKKQKLESHKMVLKQIDESLLIEKTIEDPYPIPNNLLFVPLQQ